MLISINDHIDTYRYQSCAYNQYVTLAKDPNVSYKDKVSYQGFATNSIWSNLMIRSEVVDFAEAIETEIYGQGLSLPTNIRQFLRVTHHSDIDIDAQVVGHEYPCEPIRKSSFTS